MSRKIHLMILIDAIALIMIGFLGHLSYDAYIYESDFAAEKLSNTYHRDYCDVIEDSDKHKLIFFHDHHEAAQEGYEPCPLCTPQYD